MCNRVSIWENVLLQFFWQKQSQVVKKIIDLYKNDK